MNAQTLKKKKNLLSEKAAPAKLKLTESQISKKSARKIETAFQNKLESLRAKIDKADRAMIEALAHRTNIVEKIGRAKKKHGEPLRQKSRWNQLLRDRIRQATQLGVDRKLILAIFECIQKESIARQARAESKGRKK